MVKKKEPEEYKKVPQQIIRKEDGTLVVNPEYLQYLEDCDYL